MNAVVRNPGDPFADWDATYVLGALSPEDRTRYESHLAGCDQCRAAVAALAGMPGLLARVPVEHLYTDQTDRIPSAVLPRLLAEVAHDRRRNRWRLATAGMIAAACVVALSIAVVLLGRHDAGTVAGPGSADSAPTPFSSALPVLTLAPRGRAYVNATAQIQAVAWGTRIQLRCVLPGVSPPEPTATAGAGTPGSTRPGSYSLVIVGRDGAQTQIATWRDLPGKTIQVEGNTDLRRDDITRLLVKDDTDAVVLQVAV